MECAVLGVGGAAADAGLEEVASVRLDGEAAGITGEPFGRLGTQRPGAFQQRRLVAAHVHDEGGGAALRAAVCSAAAGECDECVGGGLLPVEGGAGVFVVGALGLGDVPDGLFERRAVFEW